MLLSVSKQSVLDCVRMICIERYFTECTAATRGQSKISIKQISFSNAVLHLSKQTKRCFLSMSHLFPHLLLFINIQIYENIWQIQVLHHVEAVLLTDLQLYPNIMENQ